MMMMKAKLGLIITTMSTVVGIFPKQTKLPKNGKFFWWCKNSKYSMLVHDSSFPPLLQDFIDLDGLRQNFGTVILLILL